MRAAQLLCTCMNCASPLHSAGLAVNELHHPAAATICVGWRHCKQEHTHIKAAVVMPL